MAGAVTYLGIRHHGPGSARRVVEAFTDTQLVAVAERLGGAPLTAEVDRSHGRLPTPLSLEGRSDAPDGRRHEVVLSVEDADRTLTLRVTCDVVEVRRPDGTRLEGVGTPG